MVSARAVLLDFDAPTAAKLRVLHRLWSAEDSAPSYLVTSPRSAGEALLALVAGPPLRRPLSRAHFRPTRSLTLEGLIALGHFVNPAAGPCVL